MSDTSITPPTAKRLAAITGIAAVGAAVLFTAFVLPAEFHKDPLGVGKLTGISKLAGPKTVTAQPPTTGKGAATSYSNTAYRTDTIDIPLGVGVVGGELEYKVQMKAGDTLTYSWTVDGITVPEEFYYDFHGENRETPEPTIIEYKQATGTSSAGSLTAPAPGVHGWYLQNQSVKPVVVHLKISGFYALVPPGEYGNDSGIVANGQKAN